MNTLMLMTVVGMLPTPLSLAYLCGSGTLGYSAMMEVLEGGLPMMSHILLATNIDVRDIHQPISPTTLSHPSDLVSGDYAAATTTSPTTPSAVSILHSTNSKRNVNTLMFGGGDTQHPWTERIPPTSSCHHISIKGRPQSTTIALLSGCSGLRSVALDGFSGVVGSVDECFLTGCSGLTSIDLSPLCNVITIGASFMFGCTSLNSIDLTPFRNVRTIHRSFLQKCSGLKDIDLTPLERCVTQVGWLFMAGCTGLKSIDIRPLRNGSRLADWSLLDGCSGLASVDLSPLAHLTSIGHSFLASCAGLITLDLAPLSAVTAIGNEFLAGCTGLKELDIHGLRNVTRIGVRFMFGCSGLVSIDLTPLTNVTTMGRPVFGENSPQITDFEKLNHVLKAALV